MITNSRDQLIRDEATVLHVYPDSLGYATIGTGHLVDPRKGGSIPQFIADELLDFDIREKTAEVQSRLPWSTQLDPARFGVLVNMCFQLGIAGLLGFEHTLSLIRTGQYGPASEAMKQSLWAKQTPERANRLAEQMKTGVWQ